MPTRQTPLQRSGLRRAVLQLASLQVLALLLLGLLALFAVWSLDRVHEASLRELAVTARAVDIGRSAQLDVKRQVQEWKNTLLRGADSVRFERHAQAVREARGRVVARLADLQVRTATLGMPELDARINAVRTLHEHVSAAYEQGFVRLSAGGSIQEVDESVRGIDRPLDEALDGLVTSFDALLQPRIAALGEASRRRFEALTRALWLTLGVVSVLSAFGVWRIIGGTRGGEA